MTSSESTIQGYNGVAAVNKKHQVVIEPQTFGEGSKQHILLPILESIEERYKRLKINHDACATDPAR
ncbi:MAG: hypothetical protein GQ582_06745 [Methyloprofundus sp.]|nr:hypothetical protein [Methyloprofundus sp.]